MATKTTTASRDVTTELAYLTRALKAPTLREAVDRLAERARAETWSYEEFLAACLQREVSARESHGGEGRIRAARFPSRKSLEEFDFDHARGLKRDTIAHLGTLDFVTARDNVVFLGPPGTGKTHLATGIAIRACQAGHRVLFATASQWVDRLAAAHHGGTLQAELVRLARYPLLVVDLCRPGNYAEAGGRIDGLLVAVPLWPSCAGCCRHIYSPSRKARSRSGGRYLPGSAATGVSCASARSLMARSACR
jgi:DNA replication protein DnaC